MSRKTSFGILALVAQRHRSHALQPARKSISLLAIAGLAAALQVAISIESQAALPPVLFMPLGDLPGGAFSSTPADVSADGSVVVGRSESANGPEAFRWTLIGGMTGLGDLPGNRFASGAGAVSADGSVVVGGGSVEEGAEAFRWTETDGMVGIGDIPGGMFSSSASAVSADGSIVGGQGWGQITSLEAFRWTAGSGMVGLGFLPDWSFPESGVHGISADGSLLVGYSFGKVDIQAVSWTEDGAIHSLGELPGGSALSEAIAASADGSIVVGYAWDSSNGPHPFRWTAADGMVALKTTAGDDVYGIAFDVSSDGSVVVGDDVGVGAVVWTPAGRMQVIKTLLADAGIDMTGWSLDRAMAVSADGRTIVGVGKNPSGSTEAWLARLPVPEPSSLAAWLLPTLVAITRRAASAKALR